MTTVYELVDGRCSIPTNLQQVRNGNSRGAQNNGMGSIYGFSWHVELHKPLSLASARCESSHVSPKFWPASDIGNRLPRPIDLLPYDHIKCAVLYCQQLSKETVECNTELFDVCKIFFQSSEENASPMTGVSLQSAEFVNIHRYTGGLFIFHCFSCFQSLQLYTEMCFNKKSLLFSYCICRSSLLKTSKHRMETDGLSSLNSGSYVAKIERYKLYTKIYADINQKYVLAVMY